MNKEYIELCKHEAIQKHSTAIWEMWCCHHNQYTGRPDQPFCCGNLMAKIFIPHLGQLIEILGDRFVALDRSPKDKTFSVSYYNNNNKYRNRTGCATPEIACLNAIVELNKEVNND